MNAETFHEILNQRLAKIIAVLDAKAKSYSSASDRLHNFKVAAALNDCTPEQSNWGMNTKHIVSVRDMVLSGLDYPYEVWDEKLGDAINYLILLEAIVIERHKVQEGINDLKVLKG